jgi:hypothetical protein
MAAMETLLDKNNQQEAEAVMEFLGELDQNEKKEFLVFMQGIRFAKGLNTGTKELQNS